AASSASRWTPAGVSFHTKRILSGYFSNSLWRTRSACFVYGHWKSPNSTMVTGAFPGPREGDPPTGIRRLLGVATAPVESATAGSAGWRQTKYQRRPGALATTAIAPSANAMRGRDRFEEGGVRATTPDFTSKIHAKATTTGNPAASATTT